MIEISFDERVIEQQLARLSGAQHRLAQAVKRAVMATVPQVREAVLGVLEQDIPVGNRFVRRAVQAVRHLEGRSEFRIFSKRLFLDDYELTPRTQTARTGIRSSDRSGFMYLLRRGGKMFHSFGTMTGRDGTGSKPFIARTGTGKLRVMYRRDNNRAAHGRDVFLAYAPPIQYHAVAPHVEDEARHTTARIFHKELASAVDAILAGSGP